MRKFILFLCFKITTLCLIGCTYSITMVHTEGTASDVVDETTTPSTSINPTVTIPSGI